MVSKIMFLFEKHVPNMFNTLKWNYENIKFISTIKHLNINTKNKNNEYKFINGHNDVSAYIII